MQTVRLFRIQRFSIHDGPGIRTTVFFKGCPLRCVWCHNPEGQRYETEVAYKEERCVQCLECVSACEYGAISFEGGIRIDRELCTGCGKCVEVCKTGALYLYGFEIEVESVVKILERDIVFYRNSGGGATFSGGEPFFQSNSLLKLLKLCKNRRISVAVDTSGYARWEIIEKSINYVDLFLYDVKDYDSERHRKFTGVSNELIISNLENLVACGANVVVRIPYIPGCNFSCEDDFQNFARFLDSIGVRRVDVLPYHSLARDKYRWLGRNFYEVPSSEGHEKFTELLEEIGFKVSVGGYF